MSQLPANRGKVRKGWQMGEVSQGWQPEPGADPSRLDVEKLVGVPLWRHAAEILGSQSKGPLGATRWARRKRSENTAERHLP